MAQVTLPPGFELVGDEKPSAKLPPGFELVAAGSTAPADAPMRTASDVSALTPALVAGASAAVPLVRQVAEEIATNPKIVPAARGVGKVAGGLGGIFKAGPLGMDSGTRYGGVVGELAGKATQKGAGVVASVLDRLAPYAQSLSTLSGAQGVLDLAQLAEPGRRDIGTLGISIGTPRSDAEKAADPALINKLLTYLLGGGNDHTTK